MFNMNNRIIFQCGRPYYKGKCHVCGERIGGRDHAPFGGNVKYERYIFNAIQMPPKSFVNSLWQ